jgi:hypothetical protein
MKIVLTSGLNGDGLTYHELEVDGQGVVSIYPLCDCPEDAIIGRILVSGDDIISLMRSAYEEGLAGGEFEVATMTEEVE